MDHNVVSSFKSCLLKRIMRSNEHLRNAAGGGPVEIWWDGGDYILMSRHEFGMCATTDDPHYSIAFVPAASIRAQLCDFAGKLQSGDVLWRTRRCRVSTSPLQEVS